MAITDVLTQVETAQPTGTRRASARESIANEPPTGNSKYRDRLTRSLNSAELNGIPREAPPAGDGESPPAPQGNRPDTSSSTEPESSAQQPVRATIHSFRQNSHKRSANTKTNQPAIADASLPAKTQSALALNAGEFLIETAVVTPIDGAPGEVGETDTDEEPVLEFIPFELQSLEGEPPAQLQLPVVDAMPIDCAQPTGTQCKPPAGLKAAIAASAIEASVQRLDESADTELQQPLPPAGFFSAVEDRLASTKSQLPAAAEGPVTEAKPTVPPETSIPAASVLPQSSLAVSIPETNVDVETAEPNVAPIEAAKTIVASVAATDIQVEQGSDANKSEIAQGAPVDEAIENVAQATDLPISAATRNVVSVEPQIDNSATDETNETVVETKNQPDKKASKATRQSSDENSNSASPNVGNESRIAQSVKPRAVSQPITVDAVEAVASTKDDAQITESIDSNPVDVAVPTSPHAKTESTLKTSMGHDGVRVADSNAAGLVDRLASAVHESRETGRQLRIRLNPPELGALQIEVTLRDGALSARLDVQTPAAHQAVVDNLSLLHDALAQNGKSVERIDVQLVRNWNEEGGNQSGSEHQGHSEQQFSQHQQQHQQKQQNGSEQKQPAKSRPARQSSIQLDELDIQI